MSSILKALRKIEEEKRVASHAAPDLRMDHGHSARKGWPFLPLVAGVALGAACVGLFSFWYFSKTPAVVALPVQHVKVTGVDSKQVVPSILLPEEKLLSAPAVPQTAPVKEQDVIPPAEDTIIREVIMPVEAVPMISVQTVPQKQPPEIVSERKPSPEIVETKVVATTAVKTPKSDLTAAKTLKTDPDVAKIPEDEPAVARLAKADSVAVSPKPLPEAVHLKVSETFYHEDPANSMAVVNDLPVMIGTFVDSAMVLEIHSDKVVFKIDDTLYDVPVNPLP